MKAEVDSQIVKARTRLDLVAVVGERFRHQQRG